MCERSPSHIAFRLDSGYCCAALFASRISAVADTYASTQPFRPHVHGSPPHIRLVCPSSAPPACAPSNTFPSRIIPPPTPVPRVSRMAFFVFCAAPAFTSPKAAQFASLETAIGQEKYCLNCSVSGTFSHPKLLEYNTTPCTASIVPGLPIPILFSCVSPIPFCFKSVFTNSAISRIIS